MFLEFGNLNRARKGQETLVFNGETFAVPEGHEPLRASELL